MNTINPINNNTSFNSRYLNTQKAEKLPKEISDAIYKSDSIDEFLKEGKPKTFWDKFIDLFKKDEILDVEYLETVAKDSSGAIKKDPFAKISFLIFRFTKSDGIVETAQLTTEQEGLRRQTGSIPKPNEHYLFKPPVETAEQKMAKAIENIKHFGSLFK